MAKAAAAKGEDYRILYLTHRRSLGKDLVRRFGAEDRNILDARRILAQESLVMSLKSPAEKQTLRGLAGKATLLQV